jgi:hypothetical protein
MELGRTDRIFLVARSARSLDPEPRSTRGLQKSCSISSRKRLVADNCAAAFWYLTGVGAPDKATSDVRKS